MSARGCVLAPLGGGYCRSVVSVVALVVLVLLAAALLRYIFCQRQAYRHPLVAGVNARHEAADDTDDDPRTPVTPRRRASVSSSGGSVAAYGGGYHSSDDDPMTPVAARSSSGGGGGDRSLAAAELRWLTQNDDGDSLPVHPEGGRLAWAVESSSMPTTPVAATTVTTVAPPPVLRGRRVRPPRAPQVPGAAVQRQLTFLEPGQYVTPQQNVEAVRAAAADRRRVAVTRGLRGRQPDFGP
jgi:hypothetical protein